MKSPFDPPGPMYSPELLSVVSVSRLLVVALALAVVILAARSGARRWWCRQELLVQVMAIVSVGAALVMGFGAAEAFLRGHPGGIRETLHLPVLAWFALSWWWAGRRFPRPSGRAAYSGPRPQNGDSDA